MNATLATTKSQPITKDLWLSFKRFLEPDETTKTLDTYKRALNQFYKWLSFNGISYPTREDLVRYREELKVDHKPTTVQNYIVAVRLFFRWTAQEGLYENIADHLKGVKLDKNHKKDYFTPRQVKKILETANQDKSLEGLRSYAILALMFTGGLRTIEVSRADVGDLRASGEVTVLYIQGKGKEEKGDFVKIVPEVEDAIRAYLTARGRTKPEEPLFTSTSNNSRGARLSTRTISGAVKKAFIEAGYDSERLTAHSTRHTAVTLSLQAGQSLQEVQQFARHSSMTTTQIYAHNLERLNSKCEASIASAIF